MCYATYQKAQSGYLTDYLDLASSSASAINTMPSNNKNQASKAEGHRPAPNGTNYFHLFGTVSGLPRFITVNYLPTNCVLPGLLDQAALYLIPTTC